MGTPAEQLLASALDSFKVEYSELCTVWSMLDTKAQGNVTICGIFIAGCLGFIRDMDVNLVWQRVTLTITLVLLGTCIILCVCVLRVRSVSEAPVGDAMASMVNDLITRSDLDEQRLLNFSGDQARLWRDVNKELRSANHRKAAWLFRAQIVLIVGIATAGATILLKIWG